MSEGGAGSEAAGAQDQGAPVPWFEVKPCEWGGDCIETRSSEPAASHTAAGEEAGGSPPAAPAEDAGKQPAGSGEAGEAACVAAVGEAAVDGQGNGGTGASKRDYVRWAPEEEAAFFEALRSVQGQKPEKCLKEIVARVGGTKDYAQVRHYYYRLIKRLNKILGAEQRLDIKHPLQVHRAMAKFWDVAQQKGMRGTNMTGMQNKPRKQRELSHTVQKGVKAVMQRTNAKATAAAAAEKAGKAGSASGGARKRKQKATEGGAAQAAVAPAGVEAAGEPAHPPMAAAEQGQGGGDLEMGDAAAPPPAKLQRRTSGPSTRQQQLLALAQGAVVVTATGEGSSARSQTGAHEGAAVGAEPQQRGQQQEQQQAQDQQVQGQDQQPSSSSHSAGSRRQDVAQPPRPSAAHSMRSSGSNGAGLDCSMGQVGGKLRLQLMPLDGATAQAMAAAGHHPFLELTLSTTKSLLGVLRHLGTKWQAAAAAAGGGSGGASALFVHPPSDCSITLRGVCWGGPDCDSQLKMGDIYTTLHCPSPFQLLYSWGRPTGATSAAAATASAGTATKPASSRATVQRQQSAAVAARKERLAAELREAISAAAAEAAQPTPGGGRRQHQQPLEVQLGVQGAPQLGAGFMDLLYGTEGGGAGMAVTPPPAAMPAQATQSFAFAHRQPAAAAGMPTPRFDQQPPAAVALEAFEAAAQATGAPSSAARPRQGRVAAAAVPARAGGMPDHAAVDGAAAGEEPVTDPRKPRGLLGLLQTPAEKAAKPKKQASQRKAPPSSSRTKASGKKGGRKQGAAASAAPVPAALGPFMWAHLHTTPQPQQPAMVQQAVPQLQPPLPVLQPQLAVLQQPVPVLQPPMRPPAALAGVPLQAAGELDFGGDALMHFFDAAGAAGFSGALFEGSPGKVEHAAEVPPLPGSGGDFSLKSWPSLSPPPNFQLPDGFETGLSPVRKAAAGTLTGRAKAPPQGTAVPSGGLPLGPTDFSLLIAGIGSEGAAAAPPKQAGAGVAPAAPPRQQQQQQQQQLQQQVAAMQTLGLPQDSLFGGFSLFGPPPAGQAGAGNRAGLVAGGGGGLAPLPDHELANLTFDFGSLLGVEDAPASWMGGSGMQAPQQAQQAQQAQQTAAVGDRPFAALFGK